MAGPLDVRAGGFLGTFARITGFELSPDELVPLDAEAVRIDGAHQRKRLIQLAALAVLFNVGREYWKHMTAVGFAFPGERSGIPDSVAYHDIAHVLAEHPATPLGEIQQGAFQAGNRREDGFFFMQMVVLHFHQGVQITPATPPTRDQFDPALVLWALHRGASSPVDMTHQWDFWQLMHLPLAEARARCRLLPKLPVAA